MRPERQQSRALRFLQRLKPNAREGRNTSLGIDRLRAQSTMNKLPTIGRLVTVLSLTDDTAEPKYLGQSGAVTHIDFLCGCGQSQGDGMIGVLFSDGHNEEYWKEELEINEAQI